jgi:hypothetical protein
VALDIHAKQGVEGLSSPVTHFNRALLLRRFDNWEDVAAVEVTHRHQAELALTQGDGSDMDADGTSETSSEDDHSGSNDTTTFTGETGDDLLSWLRQGRWVPYGDLRPDLRVSRPLEGTYPHPILRNTDPMCITGSLSPMNIHQGLFGPRAVLLVRPVTGASTSYRSKAGGRVGKPICVSAVSGQVRCLRPSRLSLFLSMAAY